MEGSGKDTFYCSFDSHVGIDYIICECGDTFPSEDALKEHLDKSHNNIIKKEDHEEPEPPPPPLPTPSSPKVIVYSGDRKVHYLGDRKLYFFNTKPVSKQTYIREAPKEENEAGSCKEENVEGTQQVIYNPASIKNESEQQDEYEIELEPYKETKDEAESSEQNILYDNIEHDNIEHDGVMEEASMHVILQNQMEHEHNYKKAVKLEVKLDFYFCEVCGKSFTSEKSVNKHLNRVHLNRFERRTPGEKPKKVVCEVCGKKYASHAALRYHQRVHTGEKPYKCTYCAKGFTMPLFLQIHTRIHTGERPYECQHCPKAFSNKAALLRHDRVHTGIKPYGCPYCNKAFTQSNSMKLHVQTVHLKMPAPYKSKARRMKALLRQGGTVIKVQSKPEEEKRGLKLEPANRVLYKRQEEQELYQSDGELVYQDEEDPRVIYQEVYDDD